MSQITFAGARAVFDASRVAYEASDHSGLPVAEQEAIDNAHFETMDALLLAPVQTGAELLEKIDMVWSRYLIDHEAIPEVDWKAIRYDVASLTHSYRGDDTEMLAAWQRFKMAHWVVSDPQSTPQGIADENLLADGVAHTPAGAAAKLRYVMWCSVKTPYLMAAALGSHVPELPSLMATDGTDIIAMWSTIQSLEAMGARL